MGYHYPQTMYLWFAWDILNVFIFSHYQLKNQKIEFTSFEKDLVLFSKNIWFGFAKPYWFVKRKRSVLMGWTIVVILGRRFLLIILCFCILRIIEQLVCWEIHSHRFLICHFSETHLTSHKQLEITTVQDLSQEISILKQLPHLFTTVKSCPMITGDRSKINISKQSDVKHTDMCLILTIQTIIAITLYQSINKYRSQHRHSKRWETPNSQHNTIQVVWWVTWEKQEICLAPIILQIKMILIEMSNFLNEKVHYWEKILMEVLVWRSRRIFS